MSVKTPPSAADQAAANDRVALIALLVGAAALGFSPILVRLSHLEPTATAFHRVFLALPALLAWSLIAARKGGGQGRRPSTRGDWIGLGLAGLFFAGDLGFWHWSLRFTSVANSTLLANFAPIFVTLGAFVLFGERFSRTFLLGMALAVLGAIALMGESVAVGSENLFGDALGLVTAMFLAAYILTVGRLRERLSTATIMLWSTAATAAVLLPVTLATGEPMVAETMAAWWVLIGLALISQAGGQGLIAYALAHLPAAFSSVGLLVEPALAAIIAWILFDEAIGQWQAIGALIIFAGIFLARRGSR